MSAIRPGTCADPGPYGAHCTEDPGHRYSCYDAGADSSWNYRQDWLPPHGECDQPGCDTSDYPTVEDDGDCTDECPEDCMADHRGEQ